MNLTIRKRIFMMALFVMALFTACQSDDKELPEEHQADGPTFMSVEEVLAKLSSPLIKQSIAGEVQPKVRARGIAGLDEEYDRYFEVLERDEYTNYNLFLTDYTSETRYYLFLVLTVDKKSFEEKAVYLRFFPEAEPTAPFDIKTFTGELQLEDITGQVAGRFSLLGGATGPLEPVTDGCVSVVSIKESLCTHGGNHHVGEPCSGGNDAYYYVSVTTRCTYLVAFPSGFDGGGAAAGGGTGGASVAATTAFINSIPPGNRRNFIESPENTAFRVKLLSYISNTGQWEFAKRIIDYAIINGTESVSPLLAAICNSANKTYKTAVENYVTGRDYNDASIAFAIQLSTAVNSDSDIKQAANYILSFVTANGESAQTFEIAESLIALALVNHVAAETILIYIAESGNSSISKEHSKELSQELLSINPNNYPGKDDNLPYEWWLNNETVENMLDQGPYDVWRTVTKKEKKLCENFPNYAYIIYKNKAVAEQQTFAKFGNSVQNLNGKPDAFRHAFYQAINAVKLRKYWAKLFATAHESEVAQHLILEKHMDLYNNEVGLDFIEFENPNMNNVIQIGNGIYQHLLDGQLKYLDPVNYSDPLFWDNVSTPALNDGNHGISINTTLKPTNL